MPKDLPGKNGEKRNDCLHPVARRNKRERFAVALAHEQLGPVIASLLAGGSHRE